MPATLTPPAALLTAAEFAARYAGRHVELIDGIVVEVPVPQQKHGKVCFRAAQAIGNFADTTDSGHVTTNDSFVRTTTDPDRVRGADVCFFSYARLPKGDIPDGLLPVAPDLVVEVRSPSEGWNDVFTKVGEYLTAGVRVVVVLDVPTRSASVYRTDVVQQTLSEDADLAVPDVLPGFAVRVGRLFE